MRLFEAGQLKKRYILYLIIASILVVLVIIKFDSLIEFVQRFLRILTPLFIGVLIAYVLDRPVKFFREEYQHIKYVNHKIAHALAIFTSYLLFIGIFVGLLFVLIPQLISSISEFVGNFRSYSAQFQNMMANLTLTLEKYHLDSSILNNINQQGEVLFNNLISSAPNQVSNWVSSIASTVGKTVIGLLISVYLLADKRRMLLQLRRVINMTMSPERLPKINHVLRLTNKIFYDFVYVQTTEGLIIGAITWFGLSLFKFPYPLLVAAVVAITALVPVVGSIVGGVFGMFMMLLVDPSKCLWFLLFFVIVMQVDANVIYPHRVKQAFDIPAVWTIIAVILGGGLGGVVGALLAVPLLSVIYQLFTEELKKRVVYRERMRQIIAKQLELEGEVKAREAVVLDSEKDL